MASAIKGDTASPRPGSATAPPPKRLPHRADLRPRLPRAGDPERRQQPVGDLQLPGHRRRRERDLRRARRRRGIASLRVDGNDFLAVYAASLLGRRTRPRQPRPDADRMGDLPRRPALHLGRPLALPPGRRLDPLPAGRPDRPPAPHLVGQGGGPTPSTSVQAELEAEVLAAQKEAERHGTLIDGRVPSAASMFEDVYKDMPEHLRRQRQQLGV
jgi:hypothetical protein